MRVLVTGSSGFIGTHLLPRLTRDGHIVMGIDLQSPATVPAGATFRTCDILDTSAVRSVFDEFEPEALIHLAARTDLDETRDINGYAPNIDGVRNVVAAARDTPSMKRAVFTSSQLVCKVTYKPKHDRDYCPTTIYGMSKVRTEEIVHEMDGGGSTWCLVRPTTVWGPGMRQHYVRFFRMIQGGRFFHVGRRPIRKSYGFVGNVVHQYAALLQAPAELIHRRTFYLADYEPLQLRDWSNAFQRALGARSIPTYPEVVARVAAKVGDLVNLAGWRSFPFNSFRLGNVLAESVVDVRTTQEVCGALPYTLEEGVGQTVAWLRSTWKTT